MLYNGAMFMRSSTRLLSSGYSLSPQIWSRFFSGSSTPGRVREFAGYSPTVKVSCLIYQCLKFLGLQLCTPNEEILQLDKHWQQLSKLPEFDPNDLGNMLHVVAKEAVDVRTLSQKTQDISAAVWEVQPASHLIPFSSGFRLEEDMEVGSKMLAEHIKQEQVTLVEHGAYTGDWALKTVELGLGDSSVVQYTGFDINRSSLRIATAATHFLGLQERVSFSANTLDGKTFLDTHEGSQQVEVGFKVLPTIEYEFAVKYLQRIYETLPTSGLACVSFALQSGRIYEQNHDLLEAGHRTINRTGDGAETFYHKPDFGPGVTDGEVVQYLQGRVGTLFPPSLLDRVITNTYYNVASFTSMTRNCGLQVVDLKEMTCNDGQNRATAILQKHPIQS